MTIIINLLPALSPGLQQPRGIDFARFERTIKKPEKGEQKQSRLCHVFATAVRPIGLTKP
jgi:hypothetical protein